MYTKCLKLQTLLLLIPKLKAPEPLRQQLISSPPKNGWWAIINVPDLLIIINNKLFICLSGKKHLLTANNEHSEVLGPAGSSCSYNPQVQYNLSGLYQHSRWVYNRLPKFVYSCFIQQWCQIRYWWFWVALGSCIYWEKGGFGTPGLCLFRYMSLYKPVFEFFTF